MSTLLELRRVLREHPVSTTRSAGFKVRLEDYERKQALNAANDVLHKVGSPA